MNLGEKMSMRLSAYDDGVKFGIEMGRDKAIREIIDTIQSDGYCLTCPYRKAHCNTDCEFQTMSANIMVSMLEGMK